MVNEKMQLPAEVVEKIVSFVGKKTLFRQVYGGNIPKSCEKLIESVKVKKILNGDAIVPCCDFLNLDWSFNIDFCVELFRESFRHDKWNVLFNVVINCGVFFREELSNLAHKVRKELQTLRQYVHEEMTCYWIELDYYNFKLDFENCEEFAKFYVFLELYPHIESEIFDELFYERIVLTSYYDFYEFLTGRGTISYKLTRYFDHAYVFCYDFPKLSSLMQKLNFSVSCPFCKDFDYKWRNYMFNVS